MLKKKVERKLRSTTPKKRGGMNSNCRTSFAFQFQKHFVEMNLQKVKLTVVDRIRDGMIFKFQDSSHVQKQMENINISSVCDA